jgi:transposase
MTSKLIHRPDWKEMRRFRALALKDEGCTHEEIAEALGATKAAVSKWMKAVREGGEDALKARPRTGALPKLAPEELESLLELLAQGATEYGFLEEIWTCARVAQVIFWEFGVRYHKGHVARLLKDLGWTPQKPLVLDIRRDGKEIARWRKEVWPELKKRRGAKTA